MIEKFITALLPSIEHVHLLGYWMAFFAALLETALVVGLLLPGSTFLLLLGALSAVNVLDFGDLLWFAVAGAVLGDTLNYWLGQRYGNTWIHGGLGFLSPTHFEYARRFFARHGAKSIFIGRFIPSVKELAPFVAGTAGMRYRTFLLWNVAGAIGWGLQWIGGGYLFGQSLKLAQTRMSRVGMLLVVLVAAWALLGLLWRFAMHKGRQVWQVAVSLGRSIREALEQNPYVQRLVARHPHILRFIADRIDCSHFYGLPLTLLTLAFVSVLALFAGIVEDVVTSDPIVAFDQATAQLIAAFRAPAVLPPFLWMTSLGEPPVVGSLFAVACLLLWLVNRRYAAAGLLVSSLGAAVFCLLGKLAFHRSRPLEAVLAESSYSFPSGHATMSVAFYGFLGYLLIRSIDRWNVRVNLFFASGLLILLIGLSRIVLGVHYLSDVWAGYLAGALWLIVGISLTEWLTAKGKIVWDTARGRLRRATALGLAAVSLAGFIGYAATRTLPAPVPPAETVIPVNRPLAELLHSRKLSRTETLLGDPDQPLAFAVVAPDAQALTARLDRAGWMSTDRPGPGNMLRLTREGLNYTTAPVAPAFWNGRINDLALARPVAGTQGGKALATVRIWRTSFRFGPDRVFVGVAREYTGMRWRLFRRVSPDVDRAAERFVESLGQPGTACRQPLVPPLIGTYLLGDRFFT
ncbi:MAG: VTT domain-containing protein, partial [Desulfobulbus sp.]